MSEASTTDPRIVVPELARACSGLAAEGATEPAPERRWRKRLEDCVDDGTSLASPRPRPGQLHRPDAEAAMSIERYGVEKLAAVPGFRGSGVPGLFRGWVPGFGFRGSRSGSACRWVGFRAPRRTRNPRNRPGTPEPGTPEPRLSRPRHVAPRRSSRSRARRRSSRSRLAHWSRGSTAVLLRRKGYTREPQAVGREQHDAAAGR